MKISTGDMSIDDAALNSLRIGRNWDLQFAGNDISYVTPIVRNVRKLLHGFSASYSLDQVTAALSGAYSRQLTSKAETEILKPINYTFEEFKKNGYSQLGQETFSRLLYSIQEEQLDLEFLVAGYDEGKAHIFTVRSPAKVAYFSELGFWAIGSGQQNALGSFFNSGPPGYLGKNDLLYRCCEAKFNAENADGVGKATLATFIYAEGKMAPLFTQQIDELRPLWEKTRVLTVPRDAGIKAKQLIDKMEQRFLSPQPLAVNQSATQT